MFSRWHRPKQSTPLHRGQNVLSCCFNETVIIGLLKCIKRSSIFVFVYLILSYLATSLLVWRSRWPVGLLWEAQYLANDGSEIRNLYVFFSIIIKKRLLWSANPFPSYHRAFEKDWIRSWEIITWWHSSLFSHCLCWPPSYSSVYSSWIRNAPCGAESFSVRMWSSLELSSSVEVFVENSNQPCFTLSLSVSPPPSPNVSNCEENCQICWTHCSPQMFLPVKMWSHWSDTM